MSHEIDLLNVEKYAPKKCTPPSGRALAARRLAERGLTTAEYAVGILGAIAFALMVYTILTNNKISQLVLDLVIKAIKFFAGKV